MYVAVVMVIIGQAVLFAEAAVAFYGLVLFFAFHIVVVFIEEPHLRRREGAAFDQYCRTVPRWLGYRQT